MTRSPQSPVFHPLEDHSDNRGESVAIPEAFFTQFGHLQELHYVTVNPGAVRGNHAHQREEMLLVHHSDSWSLLWWGSRSTQIEQRLFSGDGSLLMSIPAGLFHALKNTGAAPMQVVSASAKTRQSHDTQWDQQVS
ncbi:MAG: hypothetical protein ACWA5X_04210 [bacterium]